MNMKQEKQEDAANLSIPLYNEKSRFANETNISGVTEIQNNPFKPPKHHSFDTMQLIFGDLKVTPCGFGTNGKKRNFKKQTLIRNIYTRCKLRKYGPKLCVCITMYNEEIQELRDTMRGVIDNFNELRRDPELNFTKDDLIVFLICDGYANIPKEFKDFAKNKGFFNGNTLIRQGFMK